jgi:signal transduction histidine kinase
MISQLLQQLGLSVAGMLQPQSGVMADEVETGVFHIPQAEGSPHIPAQQEFVIPFGIRSVVGFGGVLPDGSLFVVIGFAKKDISGDVAQLFSDLSHSTRIALLSYLDVDRKMVAQIRAFQRLLADREEIVADQEARVRQAMAELAHLNEALEQSNVELQQFASVASHDLQAPLRSIAGFARFLRRDYKGQLDERADDYLERVADGTKRMQQLIDDLLAYSRVELRAAPFQPVSLNEVFDDALTLLKASIEDPGAEVTRDELPTVSGDRAQLSQLVQNLIGNGVKYHGYDPPQVHASAKPNGSNWTIAVRDNGIGVAPEHHEKIFEIFHRLQTQQAYPGTGIGLAICRRIVKRHGGTIWLESQPGKGSAFYFTLKGATP